MNITAQIVGILAMAMSILSFQMDTKKKILIAQIITVVLFATHFGMLGAFTGAAMNATSIIRNIVFYNRDKKFFSGNIWVVIFALVNIVAGILTWQSWLSLLSIAGMVINTVSMSLKNPQRVRGVMLVSSPFVLVYSFLTGSIGGVINELFSEVSAIVALVRYKNKKKS